MKKVFYGWWIVVACFFLGLYKSSVVFYGFTAFMEPLVREFSWTYTQVSFAVSLRGLEMGIFNPLAGFLVDRFGSRKLILIGTFTVGLGLILLSFTQSLFMFYVSFLILAFGAGSCAGVVLMVAVANWFHKKVGLAFGLTASGIGASGLLLPIIVSLIEVYHWRTTLIILGIGMWLLGIPLSLVIRNRPEDYGYRPDGELPGNRPSNPEMEKPVSEIAFKEVLRERNFLYLNVAEFIRHILVAAVVLHVMPYLASIGISRMNAGLLAAGIPLFSIIGRFGFGWLGDLYNKRYVYAISFLLMGAGMLAFCYAEVGFFAFLFLLLFSPGFGGSMVLRGVIVREYFGRTDFGKIVGIIMGFGSIGGILGPTLAGWVFDTQGSYSSIWLIFGGLMIPTAWMVLKIAPVKERRDDR